MTGKLGNEQLRLENEWNSKRGIFRVHFQGRKLGEGLKTDLSPMLGYVLQIGRWINATYDKIFYLELYSTPVF